MSVGQRLVCVHWILPSLSPSPFLNHSTHSMNIDSTGTNTSTLASAAGEPITALPAALALPSATTPVLSFPHLAKSSNVDSTISSSAGMSAAALLALAKGANMAPTVAVTPAPLPTTTTIISTATPNTTSTVSDGDDKAAIAITTVRAAAADQNINPLLQNQHSLKQEYDELERAQQEQRRREAVIELVLHRAKIHKVYLITVDWLENKEEALTLPSG